MLVLALDTSTPMLTAGAVQVDRDGPRLLAERTVVDRFAHAEHLMPILRDALSDAGRSLREAGAIVVGLGPGPFTGLRVGIVTAAALGDALGIPVHGVPSHDALAATTELDPGAADDGQRPGELLVVTDARRREVYVTAYRDGRSVAGPSPVAPGDLPDWLEVGGVAPSALLGSGAPLVEDVLRLPVRPAPTALALALVRVAAPRIGTQPLPLVPLYLRRPDATEPSATRKSVLGR